MPSTVPHVPPPPRTMSSDSFEDGRRSPSHEDDSESALIFVSEDGQQDDLDTTPFELSSDDDEQEENGPFARSTSTESLSSLSVFLYLLSPLLKLGALISTYDIARLPLTVALPGLFFFAGLCVFSRQIWYMLSRYVRRADMEEVFLEALARGRGKERRRYFVRMAVRFSTALLRVLLVAVYLRSCADATLRYIPEKFLIPPRIAATTALALVISPLCFAPSLASSLVIYSTWLSVASYVTWLASVAYAHAKGMSVDHQEAHAPALLQGLSIIAFTYTTSCTIPLYAALKSSSQPGMPKQKRSKSFKIFSLLSVVIATALILPPVIFSSQASTHALQNMTQPSKSLVTIWTALSVMTLMFGIPSIFVTVPTLPVPLAIRRHTNLPVSRVVLFIVAFSMSFLYGAASSGMCDVLVILALLSTFTVPALLHIVIHNFRRPLSIVMPGTPAQPSHPGISRSDSYNDELLQRKERTLQRRRLARRIMWDIGVWTLLLPVSGGALIWCAGRLLGRW
ncbi:uncharacterized protein PHACADRAFT_261825 [Phanerochaete carnosa HHB-10118-sp]|uniref:Amino acid transporter transmembrane domain-containing protein n=1 Tax=Phanerochaete carnosa (strain HHB-10118-sp) TaxID=650164 RepID=K5UP93_PHACS|nr:uncharacterized protein PHACADRAFT_261825 [Phanerochaete carnosa HHB-10118-sp]EKM51591.1 hypothetical protein PHACADRAFT_261825 [Phanerochaete carnosa HHB-10118-sp]